jgi:predicted DNA-binding protein
MDRKMWAVKLPPETLKKLDDLKTSTGYPKQILIVKAIDMLYEDLGAK